VLAWVVHDERCLLKFDKDFGELAKASGLSPACRVILLRIPMLRPDVVGPQLMSLIMARRDWIGHF
jgi:predicted nuclease of predicted toxin-antitoxin system